MPDKFYLSISKEIVLIYCNEADCQKICSSKFNNTKYNLLNDSHCNMEIRFTIIEIVIYVSMI